MALPLQSKRKNDQGRFLSVLADLGHRKAACYKAKILQSVVARWEADSRDFAQRVQEAIAKPATETRNARSALFIEAVVDEGSPWGACLATGISDYAQRRWQSEVPGFKEQLAAAMEGGCDPATDGRLKAEYLRLLRASGSAAESAEIAHTTTRIKYWRRDAAFVAEERSAIVAAKGGRAESATALYPQEAYLEALRELRRVAGACYRCKIDPGTLALWRGDPAFCEQEGAIRLYADKPAVDRFRKEVYLQALDETHAVLRARRLTGTHNTELKRWREEDPAFGPAEAALVTSMRTEEASARHSEVYLAELRKIGVKQEAAKLASVSHSRLSSWRSDPAFVAEEERIVSEYNTTKAPSAATDPREEWQLDLVDLRRLFPDYPKHVTPARLRLDFTEIANPKLRALVKRYFRARSVKLAPLTLAGYMVFMRPVWYYINQHHRNMDDFRDVSREIIEDWITIPAYVGADGTLHEVTASTRSRYVTILRGMFDYMSSMRWTEAPQRPVLFEGDVRQPRTKHPKPIPAFVMNQVEKHAHLLPPYARNAMEIMRISGLRGEDALHLTEDCLEFDADGDPYLKSYNRKMKRERNPQPVSAEVAEAVKRQLAIVENLPPKFGKRYLFRTVRGVYTLAALSSAFNMLAQRVPIVSSDGRVYNFTPHQFRHSVGTAMLDFGMGIEDVAEYLDHESLDMSMRYTEINKAKLKEKVKSMVLSRKAVGGSALETLQQQLKAGDEKRLDWVVQNFRRQSLPFGMCLHHAKSPVCPHANACFTCGSDAGPCRKLVTTTEHLGTLEQTLRQVEENMQAARENGWDMYFSNQENQARGLRQVINKLQTATGGQSQ